MCVVVLNYPGYVFEVRPINTMIFYEIDIKKTNLEYLLQRPNSIFARHTL